MKFSHERNVNVEKTNAYLVGGGIASLSAAVYLIRDGHVPGKNIHILEQGNIAGGSMDAGGNPETGYIFRGGRMFDEHREKILKSSICIPCIMPFITSQFLTR